MDGRVEATLSRSIWVDCKGDCGELLGVIAAQSQGNGFGIGMKIYGGCGLRLLEAKWVKVVYIFAYYCNYLLRIWNLR